MRIITGKYKGRHFDIPRTFKARPTTDFAKENIFNVLVELVSRGCSRVVSVELDRDHHRFIQDCMKKLTANSQEPIANIIPIRGDVFRFLKSCKQQFDFIFADPPYALKELATLPDLVFERQVLKEEALFVLEHGKDYDFSEHPHFVEHRQYGSVNFSLFR